MTHVLVVDDDEGMRRLMRRLVAIAGYRVTDAASAEDGLASVRATPPDVALCDVHLPGANGLWLADRIRDVSPHTAVILATGDSTVAPTDSLRAGVIAYLVKPFDRPSLVAALAEGARWAAAERTRLAGLSRGHLLEAAAFDAIDAGLDEPS